LATQFSLIVAEQTLLRLAIDNQEFLNQLSPDIFISDTAVSLFKVLQKLHDNGATLNSRNIAAESEIAEAQIQSLLNREIPSEKDFSYWKGVLAKEKAKQNIQEAIMNGMLREVSTKEGSEFDLDKVDDLLTNIQSNIEKINGNETILYNGPELLKRYEEVMSERSSRKSYYDTGCHHLNSALTEGFAPGKVTVLFGHSGVGKSTYALYLVNKQINKQIPNLYISLEMDLISSMDRLIAQRHRIPINYLIPSPYRYSDEEEETFKTEYAQILLNREKIRLGKSKKFHFIEEPGLSLSDIEYFINNVKRTLKVPYLIVTIDLLTMLRDFNGDNKASSAENAMNYTHEIAKRTGCHIIGVVQSRRPQSKVNIQSEEDLEKLRPHIEEIKNSSAFEERSRIILSTFRKKFVAQRFIPQLPELDYWPDIMEVQILKQNMGELPMRYYSYLGESAYLSPYVLPDGETDPYNMFTSNNP